MYYIYRYKMPEDERQEDMDEWLKFKDEILTTFARFS